MAGKKMSPRQKMIGMMYLVLTAMLALNVQREILDAFVTLEDGVKASISSNDLKVDRMIGEFNFAYNLDKAKVAPYKNSVERIHDKSQELNSFITELKKRILAETEDIPVEVADTLSLEFVGKKDDYNVPTSILLMDSQDGSKGEARVLKDKIQEFIDVVNTEMQKQELKNPQTPFTFENKQTANGNQPWEMYSFYEMPLVAVETLLSKIQNDIKEIEFNALSQLYSKIDSEDFPIDTILAKVIPESNYVLLGQEYKAEVFLGGFSKTVSPEIYLGEDENGTPVDVEDGVGKLKFGTAREGFQKFNGMVRMKDKSGNYKEFEFESEYMVARPTAVVSPVAMNLLYVGVNNPLAISVPGIPDDKISVSITGGNSLVKKNGLYETKMTSNSPKNVDVIVKAEVDGQIREMNRINFRVKKLPSPYVKIAQVRGKGKAKKNNLKISSMIVEYEPDFPYNLKANIVSFKMVVPDQLNSFSKKSNGNRLTEPMKAKIDRLRPGQVVYFEDVIIKDQSGEERKVAPIVVEIIR